MMMSPSCRPAASAGLPGAIAGRSSPVGVRRGPDQRAVVDVEVALGLDLGVDRLVADADVRAGQRLAGEGLLHDRPGDVDRDREADAVESRSTAVLIPMTAPVASSSGPPLLPGLIAASVWIRFVEAARRVSTSTVRPVAEMIPVVTVLVYVPSGEPMAIASWPTSMSRRLADRRRRQAGRVDLDDREVGERVDAVDRALELAAVLELDRQLRGDRRRRVCDDVAVGQDPAGGVVDHAGADAALGDGAAEASVLTPVA